MEHGIKQNSKGFYIYDKRYKAERVYVKTLKHAKVQYDAYLHVLGLGSDARYTILKEVVVKTYGGKK